MRQFIERFSSARACVVARSALHLLVAGKAWVASTAPPSGPHPPAPPPSGERAANGNGQQQQGPSSPSPPWALERPLLCEALALPTSPSLGEEVDLFLDQAAIAVRAARVGVCARGHARTQLARQVRRLHPRKRGLADAWHARLVLLLLLRRWATGRRPCCSTRAASAAGCGAAWRTGPTCTTTPSMPT